jgi:hypothetical protein
MRAMEEECRKMGNIHSYKVVLSVQPPYGICSSVVIVDPKPTSIDFLSLCRHNNSKVVDEVHSSSFSFLLLGTPSSVVAILGPIECKTSLGYHRNFRVSFPGKTARL